MYMCVCMRHYVYIFLNDIHVLTYLNMAQYIHIHDFFKCLSSPSSPLRLIYFILLVLLQQLSIRG